MGAKKIHVEEARLLVAPEEAEHDHQPPKAKKSDDGEGIWLMSYADMMTLLMGFFALIASFSKIDATEFEKVKKETTKYFGGSYETRYGDLSKKISEIVKKQGLTSQVDVEELIDGVQMTIRGTMLFDSGSFEVKRESAPVLSDLVQALSAEAQGLAILVEGHTDNVPISHSFIASNWELSGLRAARVARIFEEKGYAKERLTIVGWGERKPLVSNQNADSSSNTQNQARNRRVTIKIYNDADLE